MMICRCLTCLDTDDTSKVLCMVVLGTKSLACAGTVVFLPVYLGRYLGTVKDMNRGHCEKANGLGGD